MSMKRRNIKCCPEYIDTCVCVSFCLANESGFHVHRIIRYAVLPWHESHIFTNARFPSSFKSASKKSKGITETPGNMWKLLNTEIRLRILGALCIEAVSSKAATVYSLQQRFILASTEHMDTEKIWRLWIYDDILYGGHPFQSPLSTVFCKYSAFEPRILSMTTKYVHPPRNCYRGCWKYRTPFTLFGE